MNQEKMTNRLIREKSPYLKGHAHNPVDWYPWGEEAFAKARREDKPIFLSIGYSTCHWCHVMEEESFKDRKIAKFLNNYFVAIKVDREERPDLDQVYMRAVQAITGSGGWPMSVFLTHDMEPFYGGTYFPPEDRWGRPGFLTLLDALVRKWHEDRTNILQSGAQISAALTQRVREKDKTHAILDQDILKQGGEFFTRRFDSRHGGFDGAPKFPQVPVLSFLLRLWKRNGDSHLLEMVTKTLQSMARGGICDQLAGGFHRYATDAAWDVPHFEKMLYDQALAARIYLEAFQATGKEDYAQNGRRVLDYVLREMISPEGAFYSAEDADSAFDSAFPEKKSEGAYYLWEEKEIIEALGPEASAVFNYCFDIRSEGNCESDPAGEFTGKNILHQVHDSDEAARQFQKTPAEIEVLLNHATEKMAGLRSVRSKPHRDEKILTDWNAMMISSLALAANVLEEPRYRDGAVKSAEFLLRHLKTPAGQLLHRWCDGEARISGFLDDYAFLGTAMLDLYEATFEIHYLEEALSLCREMIRLFWDQREGGFFFAALDSEKLIYRLKEIQDGAVPSGNAVGLLLLAKLGRLTMDRDLEAKARALADAFAKEITESPGACPAALSAIDFIFGPSCEIVIAGKENDGETEGMIQTVFRQFLPNKIVAFCSEGAAAVKKSTALIPFLSGKGRVSGKPAVYVCKNYACDLPVTDAQKLERILQK